MILSESPQLDPVLSRHGTPSTARRIWYCVSRYRAAETIAKPSSSRKRIAPSTWICSPVTPPLENLEILGWCLMTNHAHLLAVPGKTVALARTMRRTQADYSQRLNRRHGSRSGHLWQSRFYSCPVEGP